MLSLRRGTPFLKIEGGELNNKIMCIHDDSENDNSYKYNPKKLDKLNADQLLLLREALDKKNDNLLSGKLKRIYNKIEHNGDIGKEFYDNNCLCKIIPTKDPNQTDNIYIGGPSGSGKSFFVSSFIEQYKKAYPKNNIVLFSGKKEDRILDQWNPYRVPLDETLIQEPIEVSRELCNSLVIFDDIDVLQNKNIQNAVWQLRDEILETGRSSHISTCVVAHQISNYKQSRICLNEATHVVFFPKGSGAYQIKYFLQKYGGMQKNDIKKVMDLKTRAVILKKTYPMAIIYQNGCYVI